MAARHRIGLSEATRQRIQTTMLVDRLEKHILGEVEMSQTQMRAVEILLKKTLPDLSSVEMSGNEESPLTIVLQSFARNKDTE
jgi:hypothetical protein